LAGTKDVEVSQPDDLQVVAGGKRLAVILARELGSCIGRENFGIVRLAFGHLGGVAVGAAGPGVDDAADARPATGIEDIDRACDADVMSFKRLLNAEWDRGEGSLMEDDFDAIDRSGNGDRIPDIPFVKLDGVSEVSQIGERARAQIVENSDLIPF